MKTTYIDYNVKWRYIEDGTISGEKSDSVSINSKTTGAEDVFMEIKLEISLHNCIHVRDIVLCEMTKGKN